MTTSGNRKSVYFFTILGICLVVLAVALNMPGNAMIGGGGGIAMLAGMSGLFALPVFVMVIAIAVL
ncbi:MAG: hypothetical protein ACO394_13000, partial [Blastocatellia bacterium]